MPNGHDGGFVILNICMVWKADSTMTCLNRHWMQASRNNRTIVRYQQLIITYSLLRTQFWSWTQVPAHAGLATSIVKLPRWRWFVWLQWLLQLLADDCVLMYQAHECLSCWCSGRTDSCQSAALKLSILPPPQVMMVSASMLMLVFQGVFQLVEVSGRSRAAPQQVDANDFLKSLSSGQRLQVHFWLSQLSKTPLSGSQSIGAWHLRHPILLLAFLSHR